MPGAECHLWIDGNVESGAFQPFVKGSLHRTFPVHDDRGELLLPEGVPVRGRNQRGIEVDVEIQVKSAEL